MQMAAHVFKSADLIGGHLLLDLINTVNARDTNPTDWLDSPARFLSWAELTGCFAPPAISKHRVAFIRNRRESQVELERIRQLRETLYRLLHTAATHGTPDHGRSLAHMGREARRAVMRAKFVSKANAAILTPAVDRIEYFGDEILFQALSLLAHIPGDRLRVCAGQACGWMFIDTSKAGRRRWCDMAVCGNTAKANRFMQRRRSAQV